MGQQDGNVEIKLTVNPQGLVVGVSKAGTVVAGQGNKMERALHGVETQSRRTEISLGGIARAAAGLFVFSKVAGVLRDSIRAAGEAAESQAKVEAAIKSTGGAAGVTLDSLQAMAKGFQQVTTFEDDAILAGQSMLLTFTKIGKNVFPQATETILNMSTAMGSDLKSAAIQLGKALNEPVEGISALSRVGVQMTKDQEALIKAFVRAGDVESAQKIILGELEVQMGGLAHATAKTGTGPLKQFQNVLGDIQEDLGNALLPVLTETAKKVQAFLTAAKDSGKLESAFRSFANGIKFAAENMDKLVMVGSGLLAVFAIEKLVAVATAIRGIGLAVAAATAANPVLLAIGLTVTAAGIAFVAARDSAKAFNDEAQNIKEAEKQLAKYESVAQKVAALHQKMQGNNPFGDDRFAPKGAKRLPGAPAPGPKMKAPLTDEQLKAAEKRNKEVLGSRHAMEDSQIGLIANKTEQQLQALDLRYERERAALGKNTEAITLLGQARHNEEKTILQAHSKELSDIRLKAAVDLNKGLQDEDARSLARQKEFDEARRDAAFTAAGNILAAGQMMFAQTRKNAILLKTLAVGEIAVNTARSVMAALLPPPSGLGPISGMPLALSIGALGAAQAFKASQAKYAQGGIVPGTSVTGDRVPALVNSREMILNQRQQANLFAMANGRGQGGGGGGDIHVGGVHITMPAGATREQARAMGEAAADGIYSRLQGHKQSAKRAEFFGVEA